MRKFKLLLATMLSLFAWTGVMATVTQPTLTTDPNNPVLYTIKNFRSGNYATFTGRTTQLSQEVSLSKASLWYFEANGTGVNIVPYTDPSVKLVSNASANETGSVWYLVENPYKSGCFCVSLSNNASSNCWDDQGNHAKIGYWQPSASDNEGTSWVIDACTFKKPVNVTYEIYDGETKISSTTVLQEANSALANPMPGTGINFKDFFHEKFYYNYTPSGTIGDTDCTINITRTEKAGVVKSLSDLSNTKAYNIGCDRGAMIAYNGSMISTALSDATVNAQPYGKFALLNYEDNYYIFSIDEGKFIKNDASVALDLTTIGFSKEDAMVMTAQENNAPYFLWHFNAEGKYLNTNGNQPLGYVINAYSTPDPGNLYYMVAVDDFDPTAALAELDAYFHPSYFVTYKVKDTNGNVIFTSEPQPTKLGAKITTLLPDFQRPFYTFSEEDVTITEANTTVEFTATWNGPFQISTDYANAHWYDMAMRGTWYVTSDKKDGDGAYKTQNANTMGLVEDAYQWAFMGNGYDGFKIINKATGEGKSFGWTDANQVNQGIPTIMADTEGNHAWNIVPNTNTTVPANSFCLNVPGTDLYINQYGGAGGSVKFWNSTGNLSDPGSAFTVFDVPTDFAEFVTSEIAPYFETTAKYFVFSEAAKKEVGYDEAYKKECPFEAYKSRKEKLTDKFFANVAHYVLPESGFSNLKNKNYGTYMGIDPSDANLYGNYKVCNLPKQIIELTKVGDATYNITLMGKNCPVTVTRSGAVTATEEAGAYTIVIPAYGYAAFQADTESQYSCLHCAGGGDIVGWEAAAAASMWEVVEPTIVDYTIGEEGYATAYMPCPVNFAETVPNTVPEAKGVWTFDNPENPMAGKGTATLSATGGVTIADGIATVPVGDKLIMNTNANATELKNYTFMMDIMVPADKGSDASLSSYTALFQNKPNNEGDGSFFIKYDKNTGKRAIGVNAGGLGYGGSIELGTWYRVVFSCNETQPTVYVNGNKISAATSTVAEHWLLKDKVLFFADNDGEENLVKTSEIRFWDQPLTEKQVAILSTVGTNETESSSATGVKAYSGKINGDKLQLNEIQGIVPEKTPVILKGNPGTYSFIIPKDVLGLPHIENDLKGTLEPIDATGKYVLAQPENEKIGFYLAKDGKIAATKAYLELPTTEVKAYYFIGDGATAIENIEAKNNTNDVIYNIAGQRINKLQKGINIVNGKKILK